MNDHIICQECGKSIASDEIFISDIDCGAWYICASCGDNDFFELEEIQKCKKKTLIGQMTHRKRCG